jgi:hypothetical protein
MVARIRDAKAPARYPPLASRAERALLGVGLLVETATLAWLIYSFFF